LHNYSQWVKKTFWRWSKSVLKRNYWIRKWRRKIKIFFKNQHYTATFLWKCAFSYSRKITNLNCRFICWDWWFQLPAKNLGGKCVFYLWMDAKMQKNISSKLWRSPHLLHKKESTKNIFLMDFDILLWFSLAKHFL
jgi:hypothetical protein